MTLAATTHKTDWIIFIRFDSELFCFYIFSAYFLSFDLSLRTFNQIIEIESDRALESFEIDAISNSALSISDFCFSTNFLFWLDAFRRVWKKKSQYENVHGQKKVLTNAWAQRFLFWLYLRSTRSRPTLHCRCLTKQIYFLFGFSVAMWPCSRIHNDQYKSSGCISHQPTFNLFAIYIFSLRSARVFRFDSFSSFILCWGDFCCCQLQIPPF